jgi:hypothetical protein
VAAGGAGAVRKRSSVEAMGEKAAPLIWDEEGRKGEEGNEGLGSRGEEGGEGRWPPGRGGCRRGAVALR